MDMRLQKLDTSYGPGYSADDITAAFTAAVHNAVAETLQNGFPVARYEADKKQVYYEYACGSYQEVVE